jgi:hypothetical protein
MYNFQWKLGMHENERASMVGPKKNLTKLCLRQQTFYSVAHDF